MKIIILVSLFKQIQPSHCKHAHTTRLHVLSPPLPAPVRQNFSLCSRQLCTHCALCSAQHMHSCACSRVCGNNFDRFQLPANNISAIYTETIHVFSVHAWLMNKNQSHGWRIFYMFRQYWKGDRSLGRYLFRLSVLWSCSRGWRSKIWSSSRKCC